MTGMPNMPAYSSARRSSSAVATGCPSSVIATQPACFSSAMSASSSPFEPVETAPIGYTRARFASAAFARMNDVTFALSLTGVGVRHARDGGEPTGDRRRGASRHRFLVLLTWLAQVHVHVDEARTDDEPGWNLDDRRAVGRKVPTDAARCGRPSISTSYTPSIPFAGSTTRPPLSSLFMFRSARQQVQHRHPHGDAVGDLVEDHRIRDRRRLPTRSRRRGSSGRGA